MLPGREILFFGDKLEEGGNDYPVKAMGIDSIAVKSWEETAMALEASSRCRSHRGKDSMTDRLSDERPWGSYTVLGGGDGYQVKVIVVQPDKRLSYQRHARRSEHWFEVGGSGQVILDGQTRDVAVGAVVDVPTGMLHRVGNTGTEPLVFIEIQTGDYLGEDDIERIDDDFGRP